MTIFDEIREAKDGADRGCWGASNDLKALAPRMADIALAAKYLAHISEEIADQGRVEGRRHRLRAAVTAFRKACGESE